MPSAASSNLFGFANDQQQSHMVFYVGTDSQVHQVFRYQGAWSNNALMTLSQQDSGVTPPPPIPGFNYYRGGTPLAGYAWGNLNYVFYLAGPATAPQVQCLFGGLPGDHNWNSFAFNSSNTHPAPGQTGTLPPPQQTWGGQADSQHPSPLVAFGSPSSPQTQHVLYVARGGHIIDLYNDGDGWFWKDRTVSTGTPPASWGSPVTGFLAPGASPQVFFVDQDNALSHLYQQADGQWGAGNLSSALSGAPAPASPLRSMAAYLAGYENTEHVIYLPFAQPNQPLSVHELFWQNGWKDTEPSLNQMTGAGAALPVTALTGWSAEYEKTEHVVYSCAVEWDRTPLTTVMELYHGGSGWGCNDLLQSAGVSYGTFPIANAPLIGYAAEWERTDHVWFIDDKASVHELYWSGGSWHSGEVAS